MGTRKSSIVKQEASGEVVFPYKAKAFPLVIGESATDFIAGERFQGTDFQISPLAAEQAGIAKLQRDALNDRIEAESLQKLKEVQEKAYQEAYELGLMEGREKAFQENKEIIANQVAQVDGLVELLTKMKSLILADHETHIMTMIGMIASRIAMREVAIDPSSIRPVLQEVLSDLDVDGHVIIRISRQDADYLKQMKGKLGRTDEVLSRVRLEVDPDVTPGGCRVESNYGLIDATVETRVDRVWKAFVDRMPRPELRTESIADTPEDKD